MAREADWWYCEHDWGQLEGGFGQSDRYAVCTKCSSIQHFGFSPREAKRRKAWAQGLTYSDIHKRLTRIEIKGHGGTVFTTIKEQSSATIKKYTGIRKVRVHGN